MEDDSDDEGSLQLEDGSVVGSFPVRGGEDARREPKEDANERSRLSPLGLLSRALEVGDDASVIRKKKKKKEKRAWGQRRMPPSHAPLGHVIIDEDAPGTRLPEPRIRRSRVLAALLAIAIIACTLAAHLERSGWWRGPRSLCTIGTPRRARVYSSGLRRWS